ncbi:glycosyltransferase family 4 protein [Polaribacter sp.]|uniref:glycosyltransferase family 4 protein n=1 Tax=Polaribacter sp. TaxID=1920175 RepID=UPI0025DB8AF5|nr:glycosyltransferase family 4 protein [Polaribacter sp.]
MKVVIITYYWPPAGGSGVQRWLKFVKYLQDFGIEPIVYTVDDANYPKCDVSLESQVPNNITILKQPIWEPTNILFWKKKQQQKKGVSNNTNSKLLSFIRGNFFIPDPKVFWVTSSVNFLKNYLNTHKINAVISTGPPHSMHLIAQQLQKQTNIKWLADFRDPWSTLYYNKQFKQLDFTRKKNLKLEESVLNNADCVLTVSNSLKKEFSKNANRVEVITNGFDDEVFQDFNVKLDAKFSISYIGLLPKQSNPKILFDVLKDVCLENESFQRDLELNFIGDISDEVLKEIEINQLTNNSNFVGYVSHQKAIEFQKKSQVLLLLIPNVENAEGILTGKLFEYLTTKRPILAIGPKESDLSEILQNTEAGDVIDYNDKTGLKTKILKMYEDFKGNGLEVTSKNIDQYHRKQLTEQLAAVIKSL